MQSAPSIAAEEIAALEAKHGGELLVCDTPYGTAVFREAEPEVWQRFIDELADDRTKGVALRNLVTCCRVAPERSVFDAMIRRRPGLSQTFGNHLQAHCGLGQAEVRKK
jgi:hypothetical protein